jgi:hypothetical protein
MGRGRLIEQMPCNGGRSGRATVLACSFFSWLLHFPCTSHYIFTKLHKQPLAHNPSSPSTQKGNILTTIDHSTILAAQAPALGVFPSTPRPRSPTPCTHGTVSQTVCIRQYTSLHHLPSITAMEIGDVNIQDLADVLFFQGFVWVARGKLFRCGCDRWVQGLGR